MRRAAPAPRTYVITIASMKFEPQTLTVRSGDHVVWVNHDLFPHTATQRENLFNSGSILPEASWTLEAGAPGAYTYTCAFHPTMQARLIVKR